MQRYAVAFATFIACLALCASQNSEYAKYRVEFNVHPKAQCIRNPSKCVAAAHTFKCAMMFDNLKNTTEPKIIDIIPDVLDDAPNEEILEELEEREINFPAFKIEDVCPSPDAKGIDRIKALKAAERRANARCYAFLNDFSKEELDSCDTKIVEAADEQTIGDALCERAFKAQNYDNSSPDSSRHEPVPWRAALVGIGAHVSFCGRPWQPVQTKGEALTIEQKLCCIKLPKSGKIKYRPCNGKKKFNKSC